MQRAWYFHFYSEPIVINKPVLRSSKSLFIYVMYLFKTLGYGYFGLGLGVPTPAKPPSKPGGGFFVLGENNRFLNTYYWMKTEETSSVKSVFMIINNRRHILLCENRDNSELHTTTVTQLYLCPNQAEDEFWTLKSVPVKATEDCVVANKSKESKETQTL